MKVYTEIEDVDTGYKLLLSKRIDYFIDYQHNFNPSYEATISSSKLREGIKLYLAFQNTEKGKQLAQLYDERISVMIQNKSLQTIFGDLYQRSGFALAGK